MLSCRIRNIPTFLLEKCLLKDNRNVDNFDCWLQRTAEMHTFQTIPIFRLLLSFGISFFYSDMRSHFKTHFLLFPIRQNVCTIFGTWFGSNKQLTQQNMYWNRFFFNIIIKRIICNSEILQRSDQQALKKYIKLNWKYS